jgi:hypothetical protein
MVAGAGSTQRSPAYETGEMLFSTLLPLNTPYIIVVNSDLEMVLQQGLEPCSPT